MDKPKEAGDSQVLTRSASAVSMDSDEDAARSVLEEGSTRDGIVLSFDEAYDTKAGGGSAY